MNFLRFVLVTLVFSAFAAAQNNPVPFLDQPLSPVSAVPGGSGFTLTLRGAGFVSGAVANWNGTALATTFVSRAELTAEVPASDIAAAGTASVTVSNPSPGGGTSNVVFFPVATPVPGLQFAAHGLPGNYAEIFSATTADFNGDGKLDVAMSVYADNGFSVVVALGNGDGTFQLPVQYYCSGNCIDILSGDFNNDGKLDLVDGDSILLGNGDGTFQSAQALGQVGAILAGDFNEDGNLDLVGEQDLAGLYISLGNGDGTFQAPTFFYTGGARNEYTNEVTAADFNNDGRLDLSYDDFGSALLFLGNGDGTFASPTIAGTATGGDLGAADVNGDGNQDLFLSDNAHYIGFGNGDGTFHDGPNFSPQCSLESLVGDFNLDGKLDVVGQTCVLLGNEDGTFPQEFRLAPPQYEILAIGDFDGDGRLDLVTLGQSGQNDNLNVDLQVVQPAAALTPSSLTFGSQAVGKTSSPQAITFTNTGSSALTITSISITGASASEFGQTNNCGASLAVGASCKINVTFTPTVVGTRSAEVSVADNAVGSPQTVALTGTVEDFTMSSSPTSVTVTPGQAANYTVTASPVNGFNQSIAFTCSVNPAGSTCTVTPSSLTLNGSSNATANVAVVTMASSAAVAPRFGRKGSTALAALLVLPGLLGLVMLAKKRQKGARTPSTYVVLFICLVSIGAGTAGCGGGSSGGGSSGTSPRTYTLTVTGTYTAGSTTLVHSATATMVVQQ